MATTHAMVGMTLALPLVAVAPELVPVVALFGLIGGVFPDLDLYTNHRKTLHYPVYYSIAAVIALFAAIVLTGPVSVAVAAFFTAAALHAVMDAFGGGLELKPWQATSNRAVFDHYHGRWIEPRRWIRYDGAPEDLALTVVLGVPLVFVFEGLFSNIVIALLAISVLYAIVRKPLIVLSEAIAPMLPASLRPYITEKYDVNPMDD